MKNYQYRIVHRTNGEEWKIWTEKAMDLEMAEKILASLRENNKFFRFGREYALQRRPFGEWEGPDLD